MRSIANSDRLGRSAPRIQLLAFLGLFMASVAPAVDAQRTAIAGNQALNPGDAMTPSALAGPGTTMLMPGTRLNFTTDMAAYGRANGNGFLDGLQNPRRDSGFMTFTSYQAHNFSQLSTSPVVDGRALRAISIAVGFESLVRTEHFQSYSFSIPCAFRFEDPPAGSPPSPCLPLRSPLAGLGPVSGAVKIFDGKETPLLGQVSGKAFLQGHLAVVGVGQAQVVAEVRVVDTTSAQSPRVISAREIYRKDLNTAPDYDLGFSVFEEAGAVYRGAGTGIHSEYGIPINKFQVYEELEFGFDVLFQRRHTYRVDIVLGTQASLYEDGSGIGALVDTEEGQDNGLNTSARAIAVFWPTPGMGQGAIGSAPPSVPSHIRNFNVLGKPNDLFVTNLTDRFYNFWDTVASPPAFSPFIGFSTLNESIRAAVQPSGVFSGVHFIDTGGIVRPLILPSVNAGGPPFIDLNAVVAELTPQLSSITDMPSGPIGPPPMGGLQGFGQEFFPMSGGLLHGTSTITSTRARGDNNSYGENFAVGAPGPSYAGLRPDELTVILQPDVHEMVDNFERREIEKHLSANLRLVELRTPTMAPGYYSPAQPAVNPWNGRYQLAVDILLQKAEAMRGLIPDACLQGVANKIQEANALVAATGSSNRANNYDLAFRKLHDAYRKLRDPSETCP